MRQKKISSPHTCWLSTPTLYFWTTELALSCLISKIHMGKVFCLLWGLENVKGRGGGKKEEKKEEEEEEEEGVVMSKGGERKGK